MYCSCPRCTWSSPRAGSRAAAAATTRPDGPRSSRGVVVRASPRGWTKSPRVLLRFPTEGKCGSVHASTYRGKRDDVKVTRGGVWRARGGCALPTAPRGRVGGSEGCTTIERTLFFLYRNHVDVTSTPASKRTNPETTGRAPRDRRRLSAALCRCPEHFGHRRGSVATLGGRCRPRPRPRRWWPSAASRPASSPRARLSPPTARERTRCSSTSAVSRPARRWI